MGHINNVEYLRYFEAARIAWFDYLGLEIGKSDHISVLLKTTSTYLLSVVYPCPLKVVTRLTYVGNSSFVLSQKLLNRDDETLYNDAEFTLVWVERHSNKPRKVPAIIRQLLEQDVS